MQITFTLKADDLMRRLKRPTTSRDRLVYLFCCAAPLLVVFINYSGRSVSVRLLEGIAILYGIVAALWVVACVWRLYVKHTTQSEIYSVEISKADLFCQVVDGPVHRYPWLQIGEIADWDDYFAYTSTAGKHLAVVPVSAFDDADHARAFFRQSCHYWEAAKNEALWPPAPRSGT